MEVNINISQRIEITQGSALSEVRSNAKSSCCEKVSACFKALWNAICCKPQVVEVPRVYEERQAPRAPQYGPTRHGNDNILNSLEIPAVSMEGIEIEEESELPEAINLPSPSVRVHAPVTIKILPPTVDAPGRGTILSMLSTMREQRENEQKQQMDQKQ